MGDIASSNRLSHWLIAAKLGGPRRIDIRRVARISGRSRMRSRGRFPHHPGTRTGELVSLRNRMRTQRRRNLQRRRYRKSWKRVAQPKGSSRMGRSPSKALWTQRRTSSSPPISDQYVPCDRRKPKKVGQIQADTEIPPNCSQARSKVLWRAPLMSAAGYSPRQFNRP